ncbi:MAG: response regulator [Elusimicrobia bacterium]|nr:response regulator [Elusimicrobiota bacterium]
MAKKRWILVVDDDPTMLAVLQAALEHPELTVTTAQDSLQAFIQARDLSPLLIISDIQMPGFGDGTRTLKLLRDDPSLPRVPILFMTAMDPQRARALLPANDSTIGLMSKPLDLRKVRDYVWKFAGVVAPPAART